MRRVWKDAQPYGKDIHFAMWVIFSCISCCRVLAQKLFTAFSFDGLEALVAFLHTFGDSGSTVVAECDDSPLSCPAITKFIW